MIDGRWFITPHAVRRYRERHRPDAGEMRALGELAVWSEIAEYNGRTRDGREEWRSPAWFPRTIRFVVAPAPTEKGAAPQLLTVLPGKPIGWLWVECEIENIFAALVVPEISWSVGEFILDRESLAGRRARYASERQEETHEYRRTLKRAAKNSKKRLADPRTRTEYNRRERERHRIDRAERIAGRICPECGSPVTTRSGIGPTPIFCSVRCSHRVASRNWWQRKKQAQSEERR